MKLFLFVYSLLNFSLPANNHDLTKGLIAYYSFNDCKAQNEVGDDSDGILYGDIDCWCGIEGNALLLDGQNDFIEFPGPLNKAFNIQDFTLSFHTS